MASIINDIIKRPITVVMATYNGADYVEAQLESILAQTLKPQEIIVYDDGSTDATISILKKYQKLGQIQWYQNTVNIGVVANFKKGASLAKEGNDIAFSDQDDVWMPDKLAILSAAMSAIANNGKPSLVYSDLVLADKDLLPINASFWDELNHHHHQHCFTTLLFGNFVTGCTVLIDSTMRSYFLNMPEENILHDVWMAFIGYGLGNVRAIATPLVLYRQHGKNVNYQEGNLKKTKWQERAQKLKMLFTKNDYLREEFFIAAQFLHQYHANLTGDKKVALQHFMKLKNKSFFQKHLALKKAFQQKWGKPTDY